MSNPGELPHPLRFSKILSCESRFFLSGEVAENLSLLGCQGELKDGEQARAVVLGETTEHAEDGVQHLAGDGHKGLEFGFVACEQGLIRYTSVPVSAAPATATCVALSTCLPWSQHATIPTCAPFKARRFEAAKQFSIHCRRFCRHPRRRSPAAASFKDPLLTRPDSCGLRRIFS